MHLWIGAAIDAVQLKNQQPLTFPRSCPTLGHAPFCFFYVPVEFMDNLYCHSSVDYWTPIAMSPQCNIPIYSKPIRAVRGVCPPQISSIFVSRPCHCLLSIGIWHLSSAAPPPPRVDQKRVFLQIFTDDKEQLLTTNFALCAFSHFSPNAQCNWP